MARIRWVLFFVGGWCHAVLDGDEGGPAPKFTDKSPRAALVDWMIHLEILCSPRPP
jgi:hypothetical protein